MFAEVHSPTTLKPYTLDGYLEKGWFRMGQNIFTTNFLNFKGELYSAIWLRIDLRRYQRDKTHDKLIKLNSRFRLTLSRAAITEEKENLFARYKSSVSFEASPSLQHLLYGKEYYDIYNTYELNVWDDDKLIAVGFFDLGEHSTAGISSFYDPAYRKYSLGKFLIYQKINYCQEQGYRYFYPGYFVPGYAYFDYKLTIANTALQFLSLRPQGWMDMPVYDEQYNVLKVMKEKLSSLQNMLNDFGVLSNVYKYEFFDANLYPDLKDVSVLDYPVFLYVGDAHDVNTIGPVVVYDIRDNLFHLLNCVSLWKSNLPEASADMYSFHLLKSIQDLYTAEHAEVMAAVLVIGPSANVG